MHLVLTVVIMSYTRELWEREGGCICEVPLTHEKEGR